MMKKISILFLLIAMLMVKGQAQQKNYQVTGAAKGYDGMTAYLHVPKRFAAPAMLFSTPIKDGKFQFDLTVELDGRLYTGAGLFISNNKDMTIADYYPGSPAIKADRVHFMLEESTVRLEVDSALGLRNTKVLGDSLNNQNQEWFYIMKNERDLDVAERNYKFVKKHPSSPIALNVVQAYTCMSIGDVGMGKKMYDLLSDNLKKSKEGLELGTKVNRQYFSMVEKREYKAAK